MSHQKVIKLFKRITDAKNGEDISIRVTQSLKEEIDLILKIGIKF